MALIIVGDDSHLAVEQRLICVGVILLVFVIAFVEVGDHVLDGLAEVDIVM
jgi:hypothetical protein